ncbi:hypothetical protein ACFL04_04280 [Patescibacteria group bacterium]
MAQHPFITLYGINNIGKTTQAELLVKKIIDSGQSAELMKYPRYDIKPSGEYLDKILRTGAKPSSQKEIELWFVINRQQAAPILEEKLNKSVIVSEDYVGTGIAWGVANGSELEWMEAINKNLKQEDLAILLDGERFLGSVEDNHIHETNLHLTKKCRQVHLRLAERYNWPIVKADDNIDSVLQKIWTIVNQQFKFSN